MKRIYIQILIVALAFSPMMAQMEIAAIEARNPGPNIPPATGMGVVVTNATLAQSSLDLSETHNVSSNKKKQETALIHLVDDGIGQDSLALFSDGTSNLDPEEPINIDALFMSPNPTSGIVQIKLPGKLSIQVYTLEGKLVSRFLLATGERFMDLTSLPDGVYQVRIKSDEDYYSGKLLIQ